MFMLNPKLLAEAFPINKVEVFFDAEDHSNFLGFQWEMVSQGRIPIGLDTSDTDFNTIGKIGGEKEVTITIDQIPPHNHPLAVEGGSSAKWGAKVQQGNTSNDNYAIGSTGGSQPHNNMPPYIVMAFWKRIA